VHLGNCRDSRSTGSEAELLSLLNFANVSKITAMGMQGESLGQVGAEDLHTCQALLLASLHIGER
jgi:hypothetical protein